MSNAVIEIRNLSKIYRDFWGRKKVQAVKSLSMDVQKGEVFGLLGPNGSGKTTTMKMLLGLLFPTSGEMTILGKSASDVSKNEKIGYLPEESYLYRFLNADETLDFYGRLFNMSAADRIRRSDELIEMVGLGKARRRQLKEYSKGMTRRIGLAQALINDPELVLLDEPTSGLDPLGTREMKDLILRLKAQGKTVVMCSHQLADVQDVCDRIAVLFQGELKVLGRVDELLHIARRMRRIALQSAVGHALGIVDGYSDARVGTSVGLTVLGYAFVEVVKKTKTKFGGGRMADVKRRR